VDTAPRSSSRRRLSMGPSATGMVRPGGAGRCRGQAASARREISSPAIVVPSTFRQRCRAVRLGP
jgi:hypothetical protein